LVFPQVLTPDLDRGTVITKCSFSLSGHIFDKFWNDLPKNQEGLEELIVGQKRLKRNPIHPLWQEIRKQGLKREFLLIEHTLNLFAEGKLRLEGQKVFNNARHEIQEGLDLSGEVEEKT
jgi:phosphoribosylglycinamide formyltransferase 1